MISIFFNVATFQLKTLYVFEVLPGNLSTFANLYKWVNYNSKYHDNLILIDAGLIKIISKANIQFIIY